MFLGIDIQQLVGTLYLAAVLGGGAWGSMEDAERLFDSRRHEFGEILGILSENREIKDISSGYDPRRSTEFVPAYGEFTENTIRAYEAIYQIMQDLDIQRVVVDRFVGSDGKEAQLVTFVVFERGLGPSSEGIQLVHSEGDEPIEYSQSADTECRMLGEEDWYLCHSR
jgi:hypothetical protein